jgi:hypothetical protein
MSGTLLGTTTQAETPPDLNGTELMVGMVYCVEPCIVSYHILSSTVLVYRRRVSVRDSLGG